MADGTKQTSRKPIVVLVILSMLLVVFGSMFWPTDQTENLQSELTQPKKFQPPQNKITATDCSICETLAKLDVLIANADIHSRKAKAYILNVKQKHKNTQPEPVTFNIHEFCETPEAKQLTTLQDNYIAGFESIATAIQSCSNTCKINLNSAEYCAMGNMLDFQIVTWPVMSQAFQNAAILLQGAEEAQRSVPAQFNLFMTSASPAAQSSLAGGLARLLRNSDTTTGETQSIELKIAVIELYDLGSGLQALHWAGLSSDNGAKLGKQLVWLSQEIVALEGEILVATTRAKVLEPDERHALVKRAIDATVILALAQHSLAESAKISEMPSEPNTEANANNHMAGSSTNINAAAECFTQLSLNTSIVSEFGKIVKDELETCLPFSSCPSYQTDHTDLASLIKRTLDTSGKDEKLMLSVRNAICK